MRLFQANLMVPVPRTRLAARVRETGKGSAVWKAGFAAPQSAAWHSALSPIVASLDLFDPDYRTGREVTSDLHLINDSWHEASIHVDLLLTRENPEFIPEAVCFDDPVNRWSFDFKLRADSIAKVPVTWRLPEQEGNYWLTARTKGVAGRPVHSQRFVRALKPLTISEAPWPARGSIITYGLRFGSTVTPAGGIIRTSA